MEYDLAFRFWFELLPVLLAVIAAIVCAIRAGTERGRLKVLFTLATLACVLLIVAQTSWWSVLVFEAVSSGYIDDDFANYIWTVFNCTVMASYLVSALDKEKIGKALRRA